MAEGERLGDRLRLRSRSTATDLAAPGETTTAGFFLEERGGGGRQRRSKRNTIHRVDRIRIWVRTFLRFNLQFHIAVVFPTSENTQTYVFTFTTNIAIAITNICHCITTNIIIATNRCLCITIAITSRCLYITTMYFSITSINNINIVNNFRVFLLIQLLFNFTQKPTRSATGGPWPGEDGDAGGSRTADSIVAPCKESTSTPDGAGDESRDWLTNSLS